MRITQHKLAKTTPAVRAEMQRSGESAADLARRFGVSKPTARRWKERGFTHDLSSARRSTMSSLTPKEEAIAVALRGGERLSIRECAEVMKRCVNPKLTLSAVYRCLRRHGLNTLPPLKPGEQKHRGVFDPAAEPGALHADVKYLTRLRGLRAYVYVVIDRATRYVYAEVLYDRKPATAAAFLRRAIADFQGFGVRVVSLMTDNGFEWTDRLAGGRRKPSGRHAVDLLCRRLGIRRKLTKVRHPWTNGIVERFMRRIAEALALMAKIGDNSGRNTFASHDERNAFIVRFVYNYNRTRQQCLGYQTPLQAVNNHPKQYTQAGIHLDPRTARDSGVQTAPVVTMDSRLRGNDGGCSYTVAAVQREPVPVIPAKAGIQSRN